MSSKASGSVRRTIVIVGTGLIGASIGLALRAAGRRERIVGWDRRRAHARIAKQRRAIDEIAPSLGAAVKDAGVIILAVPADATAALVPHVMRAARRTALVMDVASLKQPILAAANRVASRPGVAAFVGGHPLAGTERSGPQHATDALFFRRPFALCPAKGRRAEAALKKAKAIVRRLGAVPVIVGAREHDRIVAATSAVPQIASSALALATGECVRSAKGLHGPGYESATRLARSGPSLWRGVLLANARNVSRALRVFQRRVRDFQSAIERMDGEDLGRLLLLAAARQARLEDANGYFRRSRNTAKLPSRRSREKAKVR